MSYFIEWCSETVQVRKGVGYIDAVVEYDDALESPVRFLKEKTPANNIHIGINRPLKDPALKASKERVLRSYEQTFWSIPLGWLVIQAATALCKRGGTSTGCTYCGALEA